MISRFTAIIGVYSPKYVGSMIRLLERRGNRGGCVEGGPEAEPMGDISYDFFPPRPLKRAWLSTNF